jgi:hypothetical protein
MRVLMKVATWLLDPERKIGEAVVFHSKERRFALVIEKARGIEQQNRRVALEHHKE